MTNYDPSATRPQAPYPTYPPPPPAHAEKRRRGCLWWLGLGTAAFVGLIVVLGIVAVAASSRDDDETSTGTTEAGQAEGPITNSGNTEHPPTEDVVVAECGAGVGNPAGGPFVGAAGTITNHSSEASNYVLNVEFVTPDGTRYAESPGSATAVAPGQTVEWGAPAMEEFREGTQCRLTQVERFAA